MINVGVFGGRGVPGEQGLQGVEGRNGAWVLSMAFIQPAVSGAVNARWDTALAQIPEVGMLLAGASGVYEVTADLFSGTFELTCLEIRGVAQGGNVPAGSVFGQAAVI